MEPQKVNYRSTDSQNPYSLANSLTLYVMRSFSGFVILTVAFATSELLAIEENLFSGVQDQLEGFGHRCSFVSRIEPAPYL